MGNCCSDSRSAVGGGASYHNSHSDPPDDSVDDGFRLRGYPGLVSQIELSFSASNLTDRDATSKSDPVLVVFSKGRDGALKELGRTDIIIDSPNPKWTSTLTMIYHFEVVQMLMFRVYDVAAVFHNADVKMLKLDEQLYLGEATCALAEIVNKSDRSLTLDLVHVEEPMRSRDSVYCGKLIIHAEECVSSKTTVELMLRCTDLEHKDLFSRSDPFLIISKFVDSKIPIPLCKTEVIKNDQSPSWKSVYLTNQQVGSKDSPLLIECFNFNSNGKNDLIGKVQLSIAELEKLFFSGQGANLFLPDAVGHDYDGKILKSQLFVDKLSEGIQLTFLDYLVKGCEMNFMVAVDFTASNGNPRLPDSLHFIDPSGRPNAYQKAILEVGEVLQFYNSRKRFPAWGFGARPIDGPVSHCFNLNGSNHQCEVEGIQGIMMAYASALLNVSLAGPTLFGPVISNAAEIASQSLANDRPKYFILLIITDGVVTDLQETKDAIVKASDLPLSILIFGVGGADFKEMEVFDADKGEALVNSMGCVASRNIVQFIPFQNLQSGETSPIVQVLLAELPARFLSYLRSRNIQPN